MWVLVQPGQALKIDGGAAMVQVVPMSEVTVLPTAPTPPPVASPSAVVVHQPVPMTVSPTSPVTAQLIQT